MTSWDRDRRSKIRWDWEQTIVARTALLSRSDLRRPHHRLLGGEVAPQLKSSSLFEPID
jgi:hypothetical protein